MNETNEPEITLTVRIIGDRVVFPVQYEIEELTLRTGQDREQIYFEPVWLYQENGACLVWDAEIGAWYPCWRQKVSLVPTR